MWKNEKATIEYVTANEYIGDTTSTYTSEEEMLNNSFDELWFQ